MKYLLVLLFATLPLIASAEDVVAPAPIEQTPAVDDAYSPTRVLEQVAPNFPQEQMPQGYEDYVDETAAPVAVPAPTPAIIEPEPIAPEMIDGKKATLQILDKIDARVEDVEIELDKEKAYHELKIEVKRCVRSPQESKEENMAFLRIWDVGQGDYTNIVFSGWMFSSNPALHSFEHSIYDIVLLKCAD